MIEHINPSGMWWLFGVCVAVWASEAGFRFFRQFVAP